MQEIAKDRVESSKRKRTYRSCTACRSSKTKCSGERPTCRRCQDKGLDCSYSESSQPNWIRRVESSKEDDADEHILEDTSDKSSGNRLPHTMQTIQPPCTPHSFNITSRQTVSEPREPQNSTLQWYGFLHLAFQMLVLMS